MKQLSWLLAILPARPQGSRLDMSKNFGLDTDPSINCSILLGFFPSKISVYLHVPLSFFLSPSSDQNCSYIVRFFGLLVNIC